MELHKKLATITLTGLIYIALLFYQDYAHERAHQQFYLYYGVHSDINITLTGMYTYATNTTELSALTPDQCNTLELLHSLNEIQDYNKSPLFLYTYLLTCIIILIL